MKEIPVFDTIEKESDWWDEQDLTAFFEEDEISLELSDAVSRVVPINLSPEAAIQIRRLAQQRGIGSYRLMQSWIIERLEQETAS